ncbi:FliI/YscN family ATPase [Paracoccus laeviglucosivorans]|uniref:Type III secretion system ATPase, FliI/YscN n=1 Tax=Paracoccus laeviglucosivorans TaxID=1197861 RepID=A0A521BFA9_9RHOB|nr:FliI/YscN family ATPase [Paracoccus laeviglucosivorans]SMO45400.1 type III secretion system ATPase, FliI/YscN [Paracoccus laeviglucosivorans]
MTADPLLEQLRARASRIETVELRGRVTRILGCVLHARMADGRVGEECLLRDPVSKVEITAEIIGFDGDEAILAPAGDVRGLSSRTEVLPTRAEPLGPAGPELLGRVVDGFGRPLDGGPLVPATVPLNADPPLPLDRPVIDTPFVTGLRVIDGMLAMGEGQRMGIFGAAGAGKSTLLSQIVRGADADVVVLGLIGERGREVAEFLERDLGPEGRKRAAVFVATSDRPATERLRATLAATACAEELRRQGMRVLLLIDSATRVARALREIGLAAGEPPVRRGFPPSVFAALPRLVERPGRTRQGVMTAIYTILVEGDDDAADPVADEMRSLLDGHIVLSRDLAARGHYPAIDVLRSKSRVMSAVVGTDQVSHSQRISARLAKLEEIEILVQVGEYRAGSDALADEALKLRGATDAFLRQPTSEKSSREATLAALAILGAGA